MSTPGGMFGGSGTPAQVAGPDNNPTLRQAVARAAQPQTPQDQLLNDQTNIAQMLAMLRFDEPRKR